MPETQLLTLGEARAAVRLVAEVSSIKGDARQKHLLLVQRLLVATDSAVGFISRDRRTDQHLTVESMIDVGWETAEQRKVLKEAFLSPVINPTTAPFDAEMDRHGRRPGSGPLTKTRRDLADDAAWYASAYVAEHRRRANVDDFIASVYPQSEPGTYACLAVMRRWGDPRPYGDRERRVIDLIWSELGLLHDQPMNQGPTAGLSVGQVETLRGILSGRSMGETAQMLGITPENLDLELRALCRHFSAADRLELMSRFIGPI